MGSKIDTRAIGLDVGLSFIRWLTGAENLHYGLWTGLEVTAANLGAAQAAYTEKLFGLLPEGRLRILDIGGGAGETARKLIALGHEVEIVVPSAFLAARCRANAPQAKVHECTFETFATGPRFDLCLFSESFQYIPLDQGLARAMAALRPGGEIVLADCFRTDAYRGRRVHGPKPGGGHPLSRFREMLAALPLEVVSEEDITEAVAPSLDLEQGFFNVLGHGIARIDAELAAKRPATRWLAGRVAGLVLGARRRDNLMQRLTGRERTAAEFRAYNRYLMLRLRPRPA
ncbi:MAG: class I SAM-dependent methyltransferase [Rhodobacteraceae bacterium]|nr:class I SAM-dependent methyltransferase [Paracoccaceae bacterium]